MNLSKIHTSLSACTYACLAIGVFSMLISLLWIALGGSDRGILQNAVLMMYLSIAGAVAATIIDLGATATEAGVERLRHLISSRFRGPV